MTVYPHRGREPIMLMILQDAKYTWCMAWVGTGVHTSAAHSVLEPLPPSSPLSLPALLHLCASI